VTRRVRAIGAEDGLDPNQIKRAVVRSFNQSDDRRLLLPIVRIVSHDMQHWQSSKSAKSMKQKTTVRRGWHLERKEYLPTLDC
jgi:hypothetical protein